MLKKLEKFLGLLIIVLGILVIGTETKFYYDQYQMDKIAVELNKIEPGE